MGTTRRQMRRRAASTRGPRLLLRLCLSALVILLGAPSSQGIRLAGSDRSKSELERSEWSVRHRSGGVAVGGQPSITARVSRLGVEGGEPTLGTVSSGAVLYTAFHDNLRVEVMRTRTHGRSWMVVSPLIPTGQNAHLLALDPYLYVDPGTDRVFTIDLTVDCSYLSFSDDEGESWTTNPLACGRPINDRQTLFSGPARESALIGYQKLIYYCWNDVVTSSCSKSLDGGLSFVVTGEPAFRGVNEDGDVCGGIHGHGVVDEKGLVYLPRQFCGVPMLAISSDEGRSWDRIEIPGKATSPDGAPPTVDIDSRGNIYFGWIGRDNRPYLTISRNGGANWARPLMIAAPGVRQASLPSLDVSARGRVVFSYLATRDARHPKSWDGYVTVTTSALKPSTVFESVRINESDDPLKTGRCGPGRCGDILDFLDVVIAADGSAWASFVDVCDARCARTGAARGNEALAVRIDGLHLADAHEIGTREEEQGRS